ncbi:MAG: Lrp/AsnC family transcriptional regulator [Hyphomonadaceae bacterium]|nr:Lrp/AsnC family transcriptional regulator [Hyphomonadaceae bacterium]MBC6412495.1 Lrp/AsnC family transcriptional regulator [Hyphomonadaceae bacterium]
MDDFDKKILTHLQNDSGIPLRKLGELVGLSLSACHKRVRKLKKDGIIRQTSIILSERALGYRINALVRVSLASQTRLALERFEAAVVGSPNVMDCFLLSGTSDYLIRIVSKDIEEFEALHRGVLAELPGVLRIETSFSIRTVCRRHCLPLSTA